MLEEGTTERGLDGRGSNFASHHNYRILSSQGKCVSQVQEGDRIGEGVWTDAVLVYYTLLYPNLIYAVLHYSISFIHSYNSTVHNELASCTWYGMT